jgi:hypothetical protein
MCAPSAHPDLGDRPAASATWLPLALVDPEKLLKVPGLAVHATELLYGSAGTVYGFPEYFLDGPVEPFQFESAQIAGPSQGMDLCPIESLIRVDVAQPGNGCLIQKQRFDLPTAGTNVPDELPWGDLQGLWSQLGDLRMILQPGCLHQLQPPELALIPVAKLVAIVSKVQDKMRVFFKRRVDGQIEELSGHAQVHQEAQPSREIHEDQLAPAANILKGTPGQVLCQIKGRTQYDSRQSDGYPLNAPSRDPASQSADHTLHLGQLRHTPSSPDVVSIIRKTAPDIN